MEICSFGNDYVTAYECNGCNMNNVWKTTTSLIFQTIFSIDGMPLEIRRIRPPDKTFKSYFSYFSTKSYVLGAQKNRLTEKVLLST